MTITDSTLQKQFSQKSLENISDALKSKLVSWIKSQYGRMKSQRQSIQNEWYVNLSMYYGKQYTDIFIRNGIKEIGVGAAKKWRVRKTVNLIRPMIRTEIAKLISQKPSATVIPATTSDDDMFAAQAGEQTWEFIQQRVNFQHVMQRVAFWRSITGTGLAKTWWDNDYVDPFTLMADPNNLLGGKSVPAKGNVRIKPCTTFNLFVPDLLEEEIEEQPYVFEAYTKTVTWVKQFWGIVANPDVVAANEIIQTSYMNVPGGNEAKPDSVLVIEAWIKPGGCDYLPDGGLVTIVGDTVVGYSDMYSHGQYPYAKTIAIPTEKFYGDSVLTDINGLQRDYNRTRSQIRESMNRTARPQILSPVGSIDPKRYTSEPGLIIPYKPGLGKPEPMPMQALPVYVLQEQDRIKADMEDISGQHQVSRGQAPGAGVTAATAISFLQERDDSILGTTYDSVERATEKIARQALSLVVDYWDLPRIVEVTGLDQAFDSLELKGSDIINGRNIRVEGGSSLPTSKAARQALLMDMAKMGFITGDQMLDMLDIGGIQKITERIRVDLRQAQRENLKMKRITEDSFNKYIRNTAINAVNGSVGTTDPDSGLPLIKIPNVDPETGAPIVDPSVFATFPPMVPVNDYDNHAVHIQTHNNYRKSQEFETLPDYVRDQFQRHVSAHVMALQIQQQQQMMGMGALPGQAANPQTQGAPIQQQMPAPQQDMSQQQAQPPM